MIPVHIVRPYGDVWMNLEIYEDDGRMVCGVRGLAGRIKLPPKAWVRTVRKEMTNIENEARKAGCAEIRMAGRWARVFPDYEPFTALKDGLRKRLQ